MKRNKKRYQTKIQPRIAIVITGKLFLQYREDESEIAQAKKGDFLVYPVNEALHTIRAGEYDITGLAGYFKMDVWDGKQWCAVLPHGIFKGEQHFSKRERPIDTFALCAETLEALKGKTLLRTYREHYMLEGAAGEEIKDTNS